MAEQGHMGVAPDGTKKRDEDGDEGMEFSETETEDED